MQIQTPKLKQAPPSYDVPRKITPLPSPIATFSDEGGVDEEEIVPTPAANFQIERLYETVSPAPHYASEQGLYFAGRRPTCNIIGLGRSNENRSHEVNITVAERLLQIPERIQEQKQPYSVFVIDAIPQDAFSGVEAIVLETAGNKFYFNHKPLVAVVQKGVEGLLSRLQERYSATPLRFIEAKKYGGEVIDANLFGQLQY